MYRLVWTMALCVLVAAAGMASAVEKPNIVWIVTDDQDQMLGSSFPRAAPGGATPMPQTKRLMADLGSVLCALARCSWLAFTVMPCGQVRRLSIFSSTHPSAVHRVVNYLVADTFTISSKQTVVACTFFCRMRRGYACAGLVVVRTLTQSRSHCGERLNVNLHALCHRTAAN